MNKKLAVLSTMLLCIVSIAYGEANKPTLNIKFFDETYETLEICDGFKLSVDAKTLTLTSPQGIGTDGSNYVSYGIENVRSFYFMSDDSGSGNTIVEMAPKIKIRKEYVEITMPESEVENSCSIYSVAGELVKKLFFRNQAAVPVYDLNDGVYILCINGVSSIKVKIEK